ALRRQTYRGDPEAAGARSPATEPDAEEEAVLEPEDAEPVSAEEISGDMAEELPGAESSAPSDDEAEEADAVAEGPGEAVSRAEEELLSGPSADSLDALPDIGELEPASGPAGRGAGRMPSRIPSPRVGETPEDAMRSLLGSQDPSTLARAIRTSLKKDEKG
ncbi:MAG TPA: hypothetical protein VFI08_12655, partial [Spirochaetia bacterium]|nr:hypothetical protein [Spirochaetia bacterium]